jgi:hypothetical protein
MTRALGKLGCGTRPILASACAVVQLIMVWSCWLQACFDEVAIAIRSRAVWFEVNAGVCRLYPCPVQP